MAALKAPFGVFPQLEELEHLCHPQDAAVAKEIGRRLNAGGIHVIASPVLTGASIAAIARGLGVASVGGRPILIHTPDVSFPRTYKQLTMRVYGRLHKLYAMERPNDHAPSARIVHTATTEELRRSHGMGCAVLDGRRFRSAEQFREFLEIAKKLSVACVILLDDPWGRQLDVAQESGMVPDFVQPVGQSTEGPAEFSAHYQRLNNFARGVEITTESVPLDSPADARLEKAYRSLLAAQRAARDADSSALVAFATRVNSILQDALVPLACYEAGSRLIGATPLERYLAAIRSAVVQGRGGTLQSALHAFSYEVEQVLNELKNKLPPKAEWFLGQRRASPGQPLTILCRDRLEEAGLKNWLETDRAGGAGVRLANFHGILARPTTDEVLVAGPVRRGQIKNLLGGGVPRVRVLLTAWQAPNWNRLRRQTERQARPSGAIETVADPATDIEPDDVHFDFATSLGGVEDETDDTLRKAAGAAISGKRWILQTENGSFAVGEFDEIPVLEVDRFVDRPAAHLHVGDTVITQTDGNVINARRKVDQLALSNPVFAEARDRAMVWRSLLAGRVRAASGKTLREVHRELFPDAAVEYGTFKDWALDRLTAGPKQDNLALLLSRLGLTDRTAQDIRQDLRVYRGYRMRLYQHFYRLWRRHANQIRDVEADLEADAEVDPDFGTTLLELESLITFARLTAAPRLVEGPQ